MQFASHTGCENAYQAMAGNGLKRTVSGGTYGQVCGMFECADEVNTILRSDRLTRCPLVLTGER